MSDDDDDDEYTKAREIRQYSETIYYRNGVEIARETNGDDFAYDIEKAEPMTEEEIRGWA